MNKGKNQNSILVLATLGVYLGLVLAGATPAVWAQAATAKQFSVKDEVELKDTLDKNPNSDKCSASEGVDKNESDQFIQQYLTSVLYSFKNLSVLKDYDVKLSVDSDGVDKPLVDFFSCLDRDLLPSDFRIRLDDNGYFQQLKLIKKFEGADISSPLRSYVVSFETLRKATTNTKEKIVLENTAVSFNGDQILVITRLPRGSLDSLLASDAK